MMRMLQISTRIYIYIGSIGAHIYIIICVILENADKAQQWKDLSLNRLYLIIQLYVYLHI